MATRADDLIDRRRLRRKLTFWRVAADRDRSAGHRREPPTCWRRRLPAVATNHIAKVKIEGTITEDDELLERLEDIRKSIRGQGRDPCRSTRPAAPPPAAKSIFDAVREIAAEKPVVAQVGTLAASAGYMIASATDHIVARQTSIVGSIGVLIQYPDVTGLMDKVGVKLEEVKSSPLKAEPSPFNADHRRRARDGPQADPRQL